MKQFRGMIANLKKEEKRLRSATNLHQRVLA